MKANNEVYVPAPKYKELGKKLSAGTICENGTCSTVIWQNEEYVMTGAMGSGGAGDWAYIEGYRVQDLETYKGELKPLKYGDHWEAVQAGERERAYTGMIVMAGKRKLVFIGSKFRFLKLEGDVQLSLY